jgi:glycosyltransferase involved in cell wall biosynthesis
MAAIDRVLVFRSELLPRSETFIVEQARAMRRYQPVFAGLKRLQDGIPLNHARTIAMTTGNKLIDKVQRRLFSEARYGPEFLKALAKETPSVIHAHFALDACLALPVQRLLDVPLVVTLHGYDVTRKDEYLRRGPMGRIYLRRRQELWRRASLFFCVSEYIRRKALERGFPEEKLRVHRIGVDLQMFQGREPRVCHDARVLFVGRLVENKGCIHLIRAMQRVETRNPGARLLVIGDGPLRAALESEARNRLRHCRFIGAQPHAEVRRWMQQASVLVMPSIEVASGESEGFGMVMCEAQAMGLPGIGFYGTGVEEALAYGEADC